MTITLLGIKKTLSRPENEKKIPFIKLERKLKYELDDCFG